VNVVKEASANNARDKKIMMEAVQNKLARDREAAAQARFEPPKEFVHKQAKKAEDEARHAAFGKGKDGREAMSLGKAAYAAVMDRYRKQGMSDADRMEEDEREEAIANEKRAQHEKATKVPMFATNTDTRPRLGADDTKGDYAATKARKDFEREVLEWDRTGGRNEHREIREAFAEFLTEK
jgi:hypothetical protein